MGASGDPGSRVRRRLAQLRAADAALRQALPDHRLQCARLSAVGCAGAGLVLFAGARADDILAVLDHIGAPKAHIVGLSMGGFATLHFGLRHPDRALSLCIGGCGYGAELDKRETFRAEADVIAGMIRKEGMPTFAERYAYGPTRVQYENKDPRGHAEFKAMLAEHSAVGSANTQQGVQKERPSLYTLVDEMKRIKVPTLIITGDEDWPCLLPGILMKRSIPSAALAVMPNCGHAINIEEPDEYNRIVGEFLAQVESGRWPQRDPRAVSASITGMKG
ncbi:alpha/beta fold hydrolase [Bradyrhizobium brasilense]|uniref:alpha/beta fold hydrolase n=1 Tax=Bradyrhizobium brasilense TaxID=1419277 RepID=UPI0030B8CDDF